MKKTLGILALLLITLQTHAQKMLWGLSMSSETADGVIFRTDSAGNDYTDIYVFDDPAEGVNPTGSLIQANDSYLYGMTSEGGTFNCGTIFKINPLTNEFQKLHDFDSTNGKTPYGSLVQASNGKLYGMTYRGGTATFSTSLGVLFEYDPATNIFEKKINFDYGIHAYGNLVEVEGNKLIGLTSAGGGDATGHMFEFDFETAELTRIYNFIIGPTMAGYAPRGSVLLADDGLLYGLSRFGEPGLENGGGVVFSYDLSLPAWGGALTSLHVFDETFPESENGYELMGSLIQATNGKLYGMNVYGGTDSSGTIFEYDRTTGLVTKLYDFNGEIEGYAPHGSLLQGSNGKLYGLTSSPGGEAKLFEFDIATNTLDIKTNITGTPVYTSLIEINPLVAQIETEQALKELSIYPNPTHETVFITPNNGVKIDKVVVTDLTGKVVLTKTRNCLEINVTDLTNGLYFIHFNQNGKSVNYPFIKN